MVVLVYVVLSSARSVVSVQQSVGKGRRVSLYGAVIGLVLACNGVDRTQVMRLLELINSAGEDAFGTLLAFISYQVGRRQISPNAGRMAIDCLLRLRDELGGVKRDELLQCFSMVKWVYTAVSQAFRNACRQFDFRGARSCADIVSRFNSVEEVVRAIVVPQR